MCVCVFLFRFFSFLLGIPWWLGGSEGKEYACNAGDLSSIPGSGRSPGGGNGNPLRYLAREIPWTEESGGLQSMGWQRVRHAWATSLSLSFLLIGDYKILSIVPCAVQQILAVYLFICVCACGCAPLPSLTLCNPMSCSPPGSPVHRIFQARILEGVSISSSRGSSRSRDQTHISCVSWIGRQILYHCTIWEASFYI